RFWTTWTCCWFFRGRVAGANRRGRCDGLSVFYLAVGWNDLDLNPGKALWLQYKAFM
ncbi:hypothetical protein JMJ77_0007126, partial [Colletotrichum scovillei]